MNLTIEQKLDYIIALLEQRKPAASNADDTGTRVALSKILATLPPDKVPMHVLATMAGLPVDKAGIQSVGRVMDGLGYRRYRTASVRGYVITKV
jgi:hypothetical protein